MFEVMIVCPSGKEIQVVAETAEVGPPYRTLHLTNASSQAEGFSGSKVTIDLGMTATVSIVERGVAPIETCEVGEAPEPKEGTRS